VVEESVKNLSQDTITSIHLLPGGDNSTIENVEIEEVTYNSPPKIYEPHKTVEYDSSNKMTIVTFSVDPSKSEEDKNQKILHIQPISHVNPALPIPPNSI
jgi:hypothetical protein